MSKDKDKNKNKEGLKITEEENVEEQIEFGLNEDKRDEVEKDGQKLPEEQAEDVVDDDDNSDDDSDDDDDGNNEGMDSKNYLNRKDDK